MARTDRFAFWNRTERVRLAVEVGVVAARIRVRAFFSSLVLTLDEFEDVGMPDI